MKTDSNIKRVKVLGVGIDDVSMEEGLKIVEGWLMSLRGGTTKQSSNVVGAIHESPLRNKKIATVALLPRNDTPKLIFTPGPEFLVTAQNDPEFKKILNNADLNLPDGYGLKIFGGITHVVPGVEFMLALCKLVAELGYTVGLLGGQTGVAQKTKEKLEIMFPGINIIFAIDGQEADRLIEDYDALRYVDILFVALGHPKQEKFLSHCKFQISNCKFAVGMGVGGSFDLISGKLSRAPGILQKLGLEWLWRLVREPKRFKRIFRATVIFPLMVFKGMKNGEIDKTAGKCQ